MLSRVALILLALFWVTMNVLLWRVEFAPRGEIGIAIPAKVVWRSPDRSGQLVAQCAVPRQKNRHLPLGH